MKLASKLIFHSTIFTEMTANKKTWGGGGIRYYTEHGLFVLIVLS